MQRLRRGFDAAVARACAKAAAARAPAVAASAKAAAASAARTRLRNAMRSRRAEERGTAHATEQAAAQWWRVLAQRAVIAAARRTVGAGTPARRRAPHAQLAALRSWGIARRATNARCPRYAPLAKVGRGASCRPRPTAAGVARATRANAHDLLQVYVHVK